MQTLCNELINVSWLASDADNENLSYAILLSPDNGSTWNTLDFDFNQTNYSINTLDLQDGKYYLIKLLVTDGVNTNYTITNQTFEIDNDLQVKDFSIVYQNNTERIFRILLNNTLNSTISNISWMFDTGDGIKNSNLSFDLQPSETIHFYIYNNYSSVGDYNVSFKAFSGNYIETEIKGVIV